MFPTSSTHYFLLLFLTFTLHYQLINSQVFNLTVISPEEFNSVIFTENKLSDHYDSSVYEQNLDCTNGGLEIIEFEQSEADELIVFSYGGMDVTRKDIQIVVEPNQAPKPFLKDINRVYKKFILDAGCPNIITTNNYYNRVVVKIRNNMKYRTSDSPEYFTFSFLLNCDYLDLHKNFQYGYLLISLIGVLMVIFVSVHPRILSLRIQNIPLNFQINWKGFLLLNILVIGCLLATFAQKISPREFHNIFGTRSEFQIRLRFAHSFLKHLGLLSSYFYVFICMNQFFFEFPNILRSFSFEAFKIGNFDLTKRVIFSFVIATLVYMGGLWSQNLIFYNTLSFCITVGAIKMFRFRSLKNGVISMIIIAVTVGMVSIWSYYKLPRSYNDYASELSSPLFIEVPDLVNNLYKKCSWIFVIDLIFPGAILAYLRDYDENLHIKWHGVYTMTSIFSYIFSNLIWMIIEAATSINIPFCVITYPIFLIPICIMAIYRNQMETIWEGKFNLPSDENIFQLIKSVGTSRSPKIPKQIFQAMYANSSQGTWSDLHAQKKDDEVDEQNIREKRDTTPKIRPSKRFDEIDDMFLDINDRKTRPIKCKGDDNLSIKEERENLIKAVRDSKVSVMSPDKRQSTPFFRKSRIVSDSVKKKKQL